MGTTSRGYARPRLQVPLATYTGDRCAARHLRKEKTVPSPVSIFRLRRRPELSGLPRAGSGFPRWGALWETRAMRQRAWP